MPRLRRLALIVIAAVLGCAGPILPPPRIAIDPRTLVVEVRDVRVDLMRDCGIEPSLLRRELEVLQQWTGGNDWRIIVMLNQIPAVEIWTDEARFECGVASKAYGRPAE